MNRNQEWCFICEKESHPSTLIYYKYGYGHKNCVSPLSEAKFINGKYIITPEIQRKLDLVAQKEYESH